MYRTRLAHCVVFTALAFAAGCIMAPDIRDDVHPVSSHSTIIGLEKAATKMIAAGKTTSQKDLIAQLDRKQCTLDLPKASAANMSPVDIYLAREDCVLVMAGLTKCEKCPRWHPNTSAAFAISESGAIVTNYHVVDDIKKKTLVAMTRDGRTYPVKEVLAASKSDDIAILQLDTGGVRFRPIPLAPNAPVGTSVSVISHPSKRFYMFTRGMVSGYHTSRRAGKRVTIMEITADFARGSSGAPILDDAGNAVALVSSTSSVYYKVVDGRKENLQMVFKQCIPAARILKLINQ